jgi:hypothetical protein
MQHKSEESGRGNFGTLPLGKKRCPNGFSKVSGDGVTTKIKCVKK